MHENKNGIPERVHRFYGRDDRIRTCGIMVPNHARYQLRYISIAIFLDCHTIIAKGFVFVNSKLCFFENIFLQIKAPNISFCVIEILGASLFNNCIFFVLQTRKSALRQQPRPQPQLLITKCREQRSHLLAQISQGELKRQRFGKREFS